MTEPQTTNQPIIFEHPLNEQMRVCLRLENLFDAFEHNLTCEDITRSHAATCALLRIVEITDRPDLKSKLAQVLTQQATSLAQLEQFSQVNSLKLKSVLRELDESINYLHKQHDKIGATLRANEFLKQVSIQLRYPGGICQQKTPAYKLWLLKTSKSKQQDLRQWSQCLRPLEKAVRCALQLLRESSQNEKLVSDKGFYHQVLDPNLPCQIVRIKLIKNINLYPEFSYGRHRLTIRFLSPYYTDTGKPQPSSENVAFELSCCRL